MGVAFMLVLAHLSALRASTPHTVGAGDGAPLYTEIKERLTHDHNRYCIY